MVPSANDFAEREVRREGVVSDGVDDHDLRVVKTTDKSEVGLTALIIDGESLDRYRLVAGRRAEPRSEHGPD